MKNRYNQFGDMPGNIVPHSPVMPEQLPSGGAQGDLKAQRMPVLLQGKFTPNNRSIGTTSEQVLSANENRIYLIIVNLGTAAIHINFDAVANTQSFRIAANGGYYEPFVVPTNELHIISSSGTQNIVVIDSIARKYS